MQSEAIAGLFKPPPPYSLDGWFDQVTKDKATKQVFGRLRQAYHFDLDGVMMAIKTRPTEHERAAMLIVLSERLEDYGKARGFLEEKKKAKKSHVFADYVIQDVIGISGDPVEAKTVAKLKSLLIKHADAALDARGKNALKHMKWMWDLLNAKDGGERWRVLIGIGNSEIADLLKRNSGKWMNAALKKNGFNQAARKRLMRVIALRIAWVNAWGARCAKLSPIVFALDLLLTPEDIASDAEEEKLGFLAIYTRVVADRRILLTNIIERAPGPDWKFSMDPGVAIRSAL
jgi:hypothetical protein